MLVATAALGGSWWWRHGNRQGWRRWSCHGFCCVVRLWCVGARQGDESASGAGRGGGAGRAMAFALLCCASVVCGGEAG